jgi:hypothetical protein
MNLKEVALKEHKYNEENGLIPYGGNSPKRVLESIVFGFYKPLIKFGNYADSGSWSNDEEYCFEFNIKDGGKYQYNRIHLHPEKWNYVKNHNDGTREIKKLFEFIDSISYEDYLNWKRELGGSETASFAYYYKCGLERNSSNNYVSLSEEETKLLKKAFKRHHKIFNLPVDEMKDAVTEMLQYWKSCDIKDTGRGFLNTRYEINLDNELPTFKEGEKIEPVFYPRGSRGEYCSIITLVDKFEDILNVKVGDTVTLKKYGKMKKQHFTVIDDNNDEFIAVKEKGSNEIEYLGSLDTAIDCYDALFDCNKREFKDWKKNRYHLVK